MRYFMKLNTELFQQTKVGQKKIEVRLNDEKRQLITVGDEIEFSENEHPEHKVLTRVNELLHYPTFAALYANHDSTLFGGENSESLLSQIRQFYSADDEKKYGVVGIRIELID